MSDFDELDLENLDDEQDAPEEDEDELSDDEGESSGRGNLAKALQQERRERYALKAQMEAQQKELQRAQALLERFGQGYPPQAQPPQRDPRQLEQLQQMILERPDEFIAGIEQRTRQSMLPSLAPVMSANAERIIRRNPEYKDVYDLPGIPDIVDDYIANQAAAGLIKDTSELAEHVDTVMAAIRKIRGVGGPATKEDPAKARLSSTVGKGSGSSGKGRSAEDIWAEKAGLARTNPAAYRKWADSEQGRKVRQQLLRANP